MFLCVTVNDSQNCSKNKQPPYRRVSTSGSALGTSFYHVIYFLCHVVCIFPWGELNILDFNFFLLLLLQSFAVFHVNLNSLTPSVIQNLHLNAFTDMKTLVFASQPSLFLSFFVAVYALEHGRSFSGDLAALLYPDNLDRFPHRVPKKSASKSALQTSPLPCIYYYTSIKKPGSFCVFQQLRIIVNSYKH